MSGFVKLYSSMLLSSIWMESKDVRILWVTMLTMSDPRGLVDSSLPGLARTANLTLDECETALTILLLPDKYSKSTAHEGRRVEKVDRGWLILNYEEYRERRSYGDSDDCYVYYAIAGDQVKIGTSKNPWARATELRTSRPDLSIAAVERGGRDLESARHAQFAAERLSGEWFTLTPRMSALIASFQSVDPKSSQRRERRSIGRVMMPFARATDTTTVNTTINDVVLPEEEGDAYTETTTPTTPTAGAEDLESVAALFPKPSAALPMLVGMTNGLGTAGMKAVPVDVLHEAAVELAASGGDVTPHRFKVFVTKIMERRERVVAENPRSRNDGRRSGKTLAAANLIKSVRSQRNPEYPGSLLVGWKEALSPQEVEVAKAFGLPRILNDLNEGTLVSQLARALEESAA